MILLKRTLQFFIICTLFSLITLISLYYYVKPDIPSVQVLKDVQLQTPMQVFTKDGLLINQFGEKRRIPVTIDEIPKPLIQAILATEDNRFYDHFGIDPIGIVRSALVLISTGEKKQGASTITMQLARNFFLTREKAYIRKVKEIFIALHIENVLSKDEILELYLNKIELGNRAFGIGAAAQVYYGKELKELTLAQMAMIAGLPKAPSALNPIRNPVRAKARRNVVLGRMHTEGYITDEQYNQATNAPITAYFHGAEIDLYAPYISEMVRAEMVDRFGIDDAYNKGYKVFTSVESSIQKAAQTALINNLHNYDMRHGYRGPAAILWDNETQAPLSQSEILAKLNTVSEISPLIAAAVISVSEQSAQVLLKQGELITLDWDKLKWARKYITRYRQGFAPTTATEILTPGEQIWLRKNSDNSYILSQLPEAASALVSLNPQNGSIKAIVGGYSFAQSQYNRAVQAKRQVGSNIKPFIYSAALEKGYTLASILNDAPINQWDKSQGVAWRPKNSPAIYNGPIRIRRALAQSKNVISVRLLRGVGLQRTADHLLKFGFDNEDINRSESLALGSAAITPLELARGMSAFANGGHLIKPYFIEEIQDAYGNVIFKANPTVICDEDSYSSEFSVAPAGDESQQAAEQANCAKRIISKQNAFLISQAMHSAIWGGGSWRHKTGWSGTGWRAQALKRRDLSGKTGTTNDAVDTWFSGFNKNLLTSVWVGFDNPGNPLGRTSRNANLDDKQISGAESGAKTAQPAWVDFMAVALADMPEAPIEPPEGLVSVRIDLATGLLSHRNDYTSRFEYFEKGTAPTKYVTEQPSDIFEESTKTEDDLF